MIPLAQIAARDLGESIRNYQTGSSSEFAIFAVSVLVLVAGGLGTWWLVNHRKKSRQPLLLFYDLCHEHGIERVCHRQMIQLARAHGVEDPAYLFVCPGLVEKIQSHEVSQAASDKERRRLEELFGGFARAAFGGLQGPRP